MPPPPKRHPLDKNVSPNWKSIPALQNRKSAMPWSDRIWHWLISLAGIAVIAAGIAVIRYLPMFSKLGILTIALGIALFFIGFPSQAQRNGYRE